MLSHDDVVTTYRAVLGRDPENAGIIDAVSQLQDIQTLAERLLASDEFRRRLGQGLARNARTQWVCAEIRHGLKIWIDLMDLGVAPGILQDNWEPAETNFILSVLQPGDVFVDVGANVGWFTVLAAAAVGPTGQIHAFEPRKDIAARLTASVAANGFSARCVIESVALGMEQGAVEIAAIPSEHNPGHSFLVPGELPDGAESHGLVEVRRLDGMGIDRPVRLIKVDVEGAEGLVLGGATELLKRDRPIIVSEIFPLWLERVSNMRPADYLDLLQGQGYRVFYLTEGGIGREIHVFPTGGEDGIGEYTNIVALPSHEIERYLTQTLDHRIGDLEEQLARARLGVDAVRHAEQALATSEAERTRLEHSLNHAWTALANVETERATAVREWDSIERRRASLEDSLDEARHALEELRRKQAASDLAEANATSLLEIERKSKRQIAADLAKTSAEAARLANAHRDIQAAHDRLASSHDRLVQDVASRDHDLMRLQRHAAAMTESRDALLNSTTWRALGPLRDVGTRMPTRVNRAIVQSARVAWWTASLQLPRRYRWWRQARSHRESLPPVVGAINSDHSPVVVEVVPALANPPVLHDVDRPVAFIVDHLWPTPDRDGGSIDAVNLTAALMALGYRVIFAPVHAPPELNSYREQLEARGVRCFTSADAPSIQEFIEKFGEAVSLFVLTRVTAGGQYLELIRYNWPRAKIAFVTVDLHFLREERQARLSGDSAAMDAVVSLRDREELLALRSDVTVVVSPAERDLLTAAVPGGNIVELPLARPLRTVVPPYAARRDIGFVGGYAHAPNIDAVRHFIKDVWPLVRARLPDCRFIIAGHGLPDDVLDGADDRVLYQGHVPDLDVWFDSLRLTVAPIRYGAGLKGKVLSSVMAGVPCVGTTMAMEGIAMRSEEGAITADTPQLMSDSIVKLYSEQTRWSDSSNSGIHRAAQLYSLEANRERVRAMLIGIGLPCLTPTH